MTKKDDREYYIKIYRLSDYEITFEEKIGGKPKNYIKLKEIEQNQDGSKYATVYMDDGKFRIRTFSNKTRTEKEIARNEFDFNKALGIDDFTMPISGFPDPFIVCCFITDTKIFVALFHNKTKVHYHFIYDDSRKKIDSDIVQMKMDCTQKNFPYRAFANEENNETYLFYRQGHVFTVNNSDVKNYKFARMTDMDLGQMYLVNNKALIARSSSRILFFKIIVEEETGDRNWTLYDTISLRGFIFYMKGNDRIQITTDKLVYFYGID